MFVEGIRSLRPGSFSHDGMHALFDYFEEYEATISGEQIEFDPIAICCEYTQYVSLDQYNKAYSSEITSLDELEDITTVIRLDFGFIIQDH